MKFKHTTTEAKVEAYNATASIFSALLSEVRELSKKKPDALLTGAKAKILNPVLADLVVLLEHEPEGKYLRPLDEDPLPQVSDALLHMAQFEAALNAFRTRFTSIVYDEEFWLTPERIAEAEAEGVFDDDDDGPDDVDDDNDDDDFDDDEDDFEDDGDGEGGDVDDNSCEGEGDEKRAYMLAKGKRWGL